MASRGCPKYRVLKWMAALRGLKSRFHHLFQGASCRCKIYHRSGSWESPAAIVRTQPFASLSGARSHQRDLTHTSKRVQTSPLKGCNSSKSRPNSLNYPWAVGGSQPNLQYGQIWRVLRGMRDSRRGTITVVNKSRKIRPSKSMS